MVHSRRCDNKNRGKKLTTLFLSLWTFTSCFWRGNFGGKHFIRLFHYFFRRFHSYLPRLALVHFCSKLQSVLLHHIWWRCSYLRSVNAVFFYCWIICEWNTNGSWSANAPPIPIITKKILKIDALEPSNHIQYCESNVDYNVCGVRATQPLAARRFVIICFNIMVLLQFTWMKQQTRKREGERKSQAMKKKSQLELKPMSSARRMSRMRWRWWRMCRCETDAASQALHTSDENTNWIETNAMKWEMVESTTTMVVVAVVRQTADGDIMCATLSNLEQKKMIKD